MNSILNTVRDYIIKNNIPFKDYSISASYFPKYFNQAILNKLREIKDIKYGYEFGTGEYKLSLDKNNNPYLLVTDCSGHINLIISDTFVEFNDKHTQVTEIEVLEDACMLKYLNNERLGIREMVDKTYGNLSPIEKVKLENDIIIALMKVKFNEFMSNQDNILDKVDYKDEISNTIKMITRYMDYLNYYYEQDLEVEEFEKGIYFNEPDSDSLGRKNGKNKYPEVYERVNEIIPFTERYQVLESYPYMYKEYAYNEDMNDVVYMNYMYDIGNNKYLLMMEPYDGTKYSRIAIINSDNKPTMDEFREHVKYYLELSYIDILQAKDIIRTYHTTITKFDICACYAITGICKSEVNPYYKKRIKGMKER